jgi:hypothetical protein
METVQINKILGSNAQTRRFYRGCFPCDQIPEPSSLKYPAAMVVNLDAHQFKGSHWVAIFAYGLNRPVIYFDSLALPISPIIDERFLKKFPKTITNPSPYQNPLTDLCAHYCIVFIYFLSKGISFPKFIETLERTNNSDLFVMKLFKNIINV